MHNNWGKAREAWVKAVRESYLTRDFTRALTALVCFMKPCLLLNVWHEALGHTSLKKIVGQLKGLYFRCIFLYALITIVNSILFNRRQKED